MQGVARLSGGVVAVGAAAVGVSLAFADWYSEQAFVNGTTRYLSAHAALPEFGVLVGLAAAAGLIGLLAIVLADDWRRWLSTLAVIDALALVTMLVVRNINEPYTGVLDPGVEPGPRLALAGAGAVLAGTVGLVVATRGKRCPDCAEVVPGTADDCRHCGYRFDLSARFQRCDECGAKVRAEARVCKHCHAQLLDP